MKYSATLLLVCLATPVTALEQGDQQDRAKKSSEMKKMGLSSGAERFNGMLVGRVVSKDIEKGIFEVDVDRVSRVWRNSKAENPKSLVGKRFILAGFWQRRETFNDLKVGDKIEVGLEHISVRSDHLSIAEFVRKAESKDD